MSDRDPPLYTFIHNITFGFYLFLIILYQFFYVFLFVGLTNRQEIVSLAKTLNAFIHCFIALFLIIRFNPFYVYEKRHVLNQNDTFIIFSSGVFLLVNLGIFQIIEIYLNNNLFGGLLPLPPRLHN